jgi:hypothetical protein
MLRQMNRSGRFGAKGDTVNTTHKIKAATATLTVGFLLAIAFAATAPTAFGREGMNAQQLRAVQQQQAVRARAVATNRHYQLGVAAVQQAEKLRGQAMNRYYGLGDRSATAAATQRAVELRSEAMNRAYNLGAFSSTGKAAQRAVERRSEAINRFYDIGGSTVVSTSNPFDWSNVGIGAGGAIALILAGGLAVLVRRRTTSGPSTPSTT